MHEVEKELVKTTKWKPRAEHDDRQDYLAALVKEVDRLPPDQFDNLSDEAATWFNKAVAAMNKKGEIPEFEVENEQDTDPGEPSDNPTPEDDFPPEGVPVPTPEEVAEADVDPQPKRQKTWKKQVRVKSGRPKGGPKQASEREYPPEKDTPEHDYAKVSGEKDRFGVVVGTKTHKAVELYEKGCTAKDLAQQLGGRYYNILTKLQKEGHLVEKMEGGQWRLTHKDDTVNGKRKGE